jgi:subtilisin family serine protease
MSRLAPAVLALLLCGTAGAAPAFRPTDPLASRQWYLGADRSFDAWPTPPALAPVRVAVIDSGIDLRHPEFAGRVAQARSFVGGGVADRTGHGTFVAGEIAAAIDNDQGIAGIAFPAQLLVARVLRRDGSIEPADEARAIRWAIARHARVINLSFGGLRDPGHPRKDAFSPLEEAAVDAAVRAGVLVVAAVGNGDQSPRQPWFHATYPAALSHVLGVGAYARDGSVPEFSNRDPRFVDLAAPGTQMLSTLPRSLTVRYRRCADQGYSDCGTSEFRNAQGTSFASPQVSAAAAVLFAARPALRPEQVSHLLEREAVDAGPANGCAGCPRGRDELSGWGKLDVEAAVAALAGPLPPGDRLEPNDGPGRRSAVLARLPVSLRATLDRWDDPLDVYRVRLRAGQWLYAGVRGLPGAVVSRAGLRRSGRRVLFRAERDGWYALEVRLRTAGAGRYELRVSAS